MPHSSPRIGRYFARSLPTPCLQNNSSKSDNLPRRWGKAAAQGARDGNPGYLRWMRWLRGDPSPCKLAAWIQPKGFTTRRTSVSIDGGCRQGSGKNGRLQ